MANQDMNRESPVDMAPLIGIAGVLCGLAFYFLQSIPLSTVAAVLEWYGLPQDAPQYGQFRIFDWRGVLLLVAGLGSLTTMLLQGDRLDWLNSQTNPASSA